MMVEEREAPSISVVSYHIRKKRTSDLGRSSSGTKQEITWVHIRYTKHF